MTGTDPAMTLAAFDEGLLRWGSDLHRWPAAERGQAQALLAANPAARALLAEETALAARLAAALAVSVQPVPLAARVEAGVRERREASSWRRFLNPWPLLAGAATAVALGAALALIYPAVPGLDADTLLVTAMGGGLL